MCQQAEGQKEQPFLTTLSATIPSSGLQTTLSVKGNCSKVVPSFHECMAKAFSTMPNLSESRRAPPPIAVVFKKLLLLNVNFNFSLRSTQAIASSIFIISHLPLNNEIFLRRSLAFPNATWCYSNRHTSIRSAGAEVHHTVV